MQAAVADASAFLLVHGLIDRRGSGSPASGPSEAEALQFTLMSMADDDPGTASEALVHRIGKRREVRDAALARIPRLFSDRRARLSQ